MIGQDVTASYIYVQPEGLVDRGDDNSNYVGPFDVSQVGDKSDSPNATTSNDKEKNIFSTDNEWALLDATPASCANIGIHYLFPNKPPVDLVISGPNFGRNSTALYIMSSGTIGASMEAALCGVKSIGLSYAYETRKHEFRVIDEASKLSVKLIEYLYNNWGETESHNSAAATALSSDIKHKSVEEQGQAKKDVQLYSVNVPLVDTLSADNTRIMYTHILQNQWGPVFEPWEQYEHRIEKKRHDIEAGKATSLDEEVHIGVPVPKLPHESSNPPATIETKKEVDADNKASSSNGSNDSKNSYNSKNLEGSNADTNGTVKRDKKLTQFRWKPDYQAVRESVKQSPAGNDGWAVDQGFVSVTPLKACFHCVEIKGDIKF